VECRRSLSSPSRNRHCGYVGGLCEEGGGRIAAHSGEGEDIRQKKKSRLTQLDLVGGETTTTTGGGEENILKGTQEGWRNSYVEGVYRQGEGLFGRKNKKTHETPDNYSKTQNTWRGPKEGGGTINRESRKGRDQQFKTIA